MNKKWIKNTKIKTKTKYELFGGIWVTNKQWERERERNLFESDKHHSKSTISWQSSRKKKLF